MKLLKKGKVACQVSITKQSVFSEMYIRALGNFFNQLFLPEASVL